MSMFGLVNHTFQLTILAQHEELRTSNFITLRVATLALGAAAATTWNYRRASSWSSPDGGDTRADLAGHKFNYESTPPWDALGKIKDHCLSNGCSSDSKFEVDTNVVKDDQLVGAKIKIAVGGSFNDPGQEGSLNQLVKIVESVAAHSPHDVKSVPYQVGNGCIPGPIGPTPCDCEFAQALVFLIRKGKTHTDLNMVTSGKTEHVDQYHLTDMIWSASRARAAIRRPT
ncbi:hypothetical protein J3459_017063 [Metarhizium acridum]|nr:hypothetical protein J3459_017063 [Metarhizium acridum]